MLQIIDYKKSNLDNLEQKSVNTQRIEVSVYTGGRMLNPLTSGFLVSALHEYLYRQISITKVAVEV